MIGSQKYELELPNLPKKYFTHRLTDVIIPTLGYTNKQFINDGLLIYHSFSVPLNTQIQIQIEQLTMQHLMKPFDNSISTRS